MSLIHIHLSKKDAKVWITLVATVLVGLGAQANVFPESAKMFLSVGSIIGSAVLGVTVTPPTVRRRTRGPRRGGE